MCGPRSTVVSIGDCGSPDRSSIPLEGPFLILKNSEFAFGWHFYVVSINRMLIQKLADQLGEDFQKLKGKSLEKKFLKWFSQKIQEKNLKAKLAIKEEMESSKFGIF